SSHDIHTQSELLTTSTTPLTVPSSSCPSDICSTVDTVVSPPPSILSISLPDDFSYPICLPTSLHSPPDLVNTGNCPVTLVASNNSSPSDTHSPTVASTLVDCLPVTSPPELPLSPTVIVVPAPHQDSPPSQITPDVAPLLPLNALVQPPVPSPKVHLAASTHIHAAPMSPIEDPLAIPVTLISSNADPSASSDVTSKEDLLSFNPKPKRTSPNVSVRPSSPSILDILLSNTQDKEDIALLATPPDPSPSTVNKSEAQSLLVDSLPVEVKECFHNIITTGPPTKTAFSKPTYAQKARFTLERCPFCEKKFYTKNACTQHVESVHKPQQLINKSNKNDSVTLSITEVSSSQEDFAPAPNQRQIIKKSDKFILKSNTTSLFPVVPPYEFFCHICVEYFSTDLTKAQHYKIAHHITLKNVSHQFKTKEVKIPAASPPSKTIVNSSIIKKKVSVPHVEDHQPVYIPVTQQPVGSYPLLDPKLISCQKNSMPSIERTIISQDIPAVNIDISQKLISPADSNKKNPPSTKSSNQTKKDKLPPSKSKNNSGISHEQRNSNSSPPKNCSLCSFVAIKAVGLRLHYYRSHGVRQPAIASASQSDPCLSSAVSQESIADDPSVLLNNSTPLIFENSSHPAPANLLPPVSANIEKQTPADPSTFNENNTLPHSDSTDVQVFLPFSNHPDRLHHPYPYVSFKQNVLKYCFPLPFKMHCPYKNCSASFGTKAWYLTNSSIKKHLNVFHKTPPKSVEFWCFCCRKKISKNPSKHSCLKNHLVLPRQPVNDEDEWSRSICKNFTTASKLGRLNHLAAHKKEDFKNKAPGLIIPPPAKQSRKAFRKKVQNLAEGDPGSLSLAPLLANTSNHDDPPAPEDVIPSDDEDEEIQKIDIPEVSLLSPFLEPLDALLEVDDLADALPKFESIVEGVVESVREFFHLTPPTTERPSTTISKKRVFDPQNAQEVQKLYRWNRRRCVRNITQPQSTPCSIRKDALFSSFQKIWGLPEETFELHTESPPERPPILENLDPEFVLECLQSSENSAPGTDKITYKQWREVDPRCVTLTKIFNVCLKLHDVPTSWKISKTILIHKSGDLDDIANWRPIALSNTIYKLFMECLTRKTQDWCSLHQVLSPSQKGFTPFDGVIEHNFLLAQHLETARRNHSDSFVAWLDVSNAFGSVPHSVIFQALKNIGVDADFISLIQNVYMGSCTSIISDEGLTDPIPILRGVKQGCPLSGILFNIAINHVLVEVQKDQPTHCILAFADDLVLL
ncbi:retrovirus-related Pol polyprotein from type-2 retrotransposable element R2DM, partial [Nephila pilipes]